MQTAITGGIAMSDIMRPMSFEQLLKLDINRT